MESSHRSIVPNIPGVPWWAAVLVAVGFTAVGYAFDTSHKELTHTFAVFYIAGCVVAVLAVRQVAVFTAVIQPPLILFCAVPGAYWVFHGGKADKFKDLLINCGYPLIERFPLMLGTAGLILLIGLIRWYLGKNGRTTSAPADAATRQTAAQRPSLLDGIVTKVRSLLAGDSYDDAADADAADAAPPAHANRRASRTSRTTRGSSRTAQRTARSGTRHVRPDESNEPGGERPRRTTRKNSMRPTNSADYDPADLPPRPRRRRPQADTDLGARPYRDMRREPQPRRSPPEQAYERPEPRGGRFSPYDTHRRPEPSERSEHRNRHERRAGGYEPYPPYEPRSQRTTGSHTANPTHHPISQVRYRGQAPRDERRDDPRSDRPTRSRAPRRSQTESWEYDA